MASHDKKAISMCAAANKNSIKADPARRSFRFRNAVFMRRLESSSRIFMTAQPNRFQAAPPLNEEEGHARFVGCRYPCRGTRPRGKRKEHRVIRGQPLAGCRNARDRADARWLAVLRRSGT